MPNKQQSQGASNGLVACSLGSSPSNGPTSTASRFVSQRQHAFGNCQQQSRLGKVIRINNFAANQMTSSDTEQTYASARGSLQVDADCGGASSHQGGRRKQTSCSNGNGDSCRGAQLVQQVDGAKLVNCQQFVTTRMHRSKIHSSSTSNKRLARRALLQQASDALKSESDSGHYRSKSDEVENCSLISYNSPSEHSVETVIFRGKGPLSISHASSAGSQTPQHIELLGPSNMNKVSSIGNRIIQQQQLQQQQQQLQQTQLQQSAAAQVASVPSPQHQCQKNQQQHLECSSLSAPQESSSFGIRIVREGEMIKKSEIQSQRDHRKERVTSCGAGQHASHLQSLASSPSRRISNAISSSRVRRKAKKKASCSNSSSQQPNWSEELWVDGPNATQGSSVDDLENNEEDEDVNYLEKQQRIKDWIQQHTKTIWLEYKSTRQQQRQCRQSCCSCNHHHHDHGHGCGGAATKVVAVAAVASPSVALTSNSVANKGSSSVLSLPVMSDVSCQTETNGNTNEATQQQQQQQQQPQVANNNHQQQQQTTQQSKMNSSTIYSVNGTSGMLSGNMTSNGVYVPGFLSNDKKAAMDWIYNDELMPLKDFEDDEYLYVEQSNDDNGLGLYDFGHRGALSEQNCCENGDESCNCSVRELDDPIDTQSEPIAEPPKQLKLEQFLSQLIAVTAPSRNSGHSLPRKHHQRDSGRGLNLLDEHRDCTLPRNYNAKLSVANLSNSDSASGEAAAEPLRPPNGSNVDVDCLLQDKTSFTCAVSTAQAAFLSDLDTPKNIGHSNNVAVLPTSPRVNRLIAATNVVAVSLPPSTPCHSITSSPSKSSSRKQQQQHKRNTTSTTTSGHGTTSEGECSSVAKKSSNASSVVQAPASNGSGSSALVVQSQPASSGYDSTIQDDESDRDLPTRHRGSGSGPINGHRGSSGLVAALGNGLTSATVQSVQKVNTRVKLRNDKGNLSGKSKRSRESIELKRNSTSSEKCSFLCCKFSNFY